MLTSACGTYVPQSEEFYERGPDTKSLEIKIKEKIFCELKSAVVELNSNPTYLIRAGNVEKKPVPESWGVIFTLQLIVVENSSFSPGVSINSPAPSKFFKLALGGVASSEATRTDKFTFYYLIRDLQIPDTQCSNPAPSDFEGSSLLLTSRLGIFEWLIMALGVRDTTGISVKSKEEVLSYDVKFNVVTSGNVTPSWTLDRVVTEPSNFFSTKRDRTHELILSFGPAEEQPKDKSNRAARAQPAPLVLFDNLATQFRSATTDAFRANRF